jgi:hypothetical protein
VLLGALFGLPGGAQSGPILNPINGHYYEAVPASGGISWNNARIAVAGRTYRGLQGYLATLTSASENAFVVENFPTAVLRSYWLGGFQPPGSTEPAGGWTWLTGETWAYTDWNTGEPNNQGQEDALALDNSTHWNDGPVDFPYGGFMVEYSAPDLPANPPPAVQLGPGVGYAFDSPRDLQASDLDGDGYLDLFAESTSGSIGILYGRGDGAFAPVVLMPSGRTGASETHQILNVDVDGDGRPDLVATLPHENVLAVHPNLGGRRYGAPRRYPAGTYCNGVAAADFNHDGWIDLAADNFIGGAMVVLMNVGGGVFSGPVSYPGGGSASKICASDLNGDGWADLAMSVYSPSRVFIYLNDRTGRFLSAHQYLISGGSASTGQVFPSDFNGDGRPDLAIANTTDSPNNVQVLLGNGNGSLQLLPRVSANDLPMLIQPGDLNCDGIPDVAVPNFHASFFSTMINLGGGFLAPGQKWGVGLINDCTALAVGDFNQDSRDDVAVSSRGTGQVFVFLNRTPATTLLAPTNLQVSAVSTASLRVTWKDNSAGEDGYRLERAAGGGFSEIAILPPDTTAFSDSGLTANTTYQYRVRAFRRSRLSVFAGPRTGLTLPAQPLSANAALGAGSAVLVTWRDSNVPTARVEVERSEDRGVIFAAVATLPPTTDPGNLGSWLDSTVLPSRTYRYRLRTTNASGSSPFTGTGDVSTLPRSRLRTRLRTWPSARFRRRRSE